MKGGTWPDRNLNIPLNGTVCSTLVIRQISRLEVYSPPLLRRRPVHLYYGLWSYKVIFYTVIAHRLRVLVSPLCTSWAFFYTDLCSSIIRQACPCVFHKRFMRSSCRFPFGRRRQGARRYIATRAHRDICLLANRTRKCRAIGHFLIPKLLSFKLLNK